MKIRTILVTMLCSIFLLYGVVYATPYTNSSSTYSINSISTVLKSGSVEGDTSTDLETPDGKIGATASATIDGVIAVETWQDTYNNDGTSTGAFGSWSEPWYTVSTAGMYNLDFTITGGEISMIDESTLTHPPDQNAVLYIDITLNGYNIWESRNYLYGSGVTHSYTVTGTDIGGTEFHTTDMSGTHDFGVTFGEYNEILSIGYYEVNDRIRLSYAMSAHTRNYDSEWADIWAEGSMFGNIRYNGDPTAPVPEPATMLLLGSGLIGLAGIGRKKFKK